MEKEVNEAADIGFVFSSIMGGESAFGGKEVVVVMVRKSDSHASGKRRYRLLAAQKTSTLQKELKEAGSLGFDYCGQTVFESAFGGKEVSVLIEQRETETPRPVEYRLLATAKTSTMQKELSEAGRGGFEFLGVVVGQTAIGGKEVVSILRRRHID